MHCRAFRDQKVDPDQPLSSYLKPCLRPDEKTIYHTPLNSAFQRENQAAVDCCSLTKYTKTYPEQSKHEGSC